MAHVTTVSPATVIAPRGSLWAAEIAARVIDVLGSAGTLWHTSRRARTREAEANEVRRLAEAWRNEDPRFAADLLAAADRHENS